MAFPTRANLRTERGVGARCDRSASGLRVLLGARIVAGVEVVGHGGGEAVEVAEALREHGVHVRRVTSS